MGRETVESSIVREGQRGTLRDSRAALGVGWEPVESTKEVRGILISVLQVPAGLKCDCSKLSLAQTLINIWVTHHVRSNKSIEW